jgi:type VI secretion system secreted protein VgrG
MPCSSRDLADDLLHGHLLENALIDPVREVRQLRAQGNLVAGQALARLALGDAVDQPVNPRAVRRQLQKRQFVQHAFEVDRGLFADQFQLEFERRVEGLATGERQHLEVAVDAIDGQIEMRLVGR